MKTVRTGILFIGVFLISACFSTPPEESVDLGLVSAYKERTSVTEVIDYENEMPEWMTRYFNAGLAGIEAMPEFDGRYVFISRQTGNNLGSLRLWAEGFSISQDFPRLVSARIQARFIANGRGNPGEEYGRYFEAVVKNSADTTFDGPVQESSFWVKKRIFADDGVSSLGETYEYFIMTSIAKDAMQRQINMLLITTRPDKSPTREQSAAAMRLRLNFYEGF
jgi:hypothetical protein